MGIGMRGNFACEVQGSRRLGGCFVGLLPLRTWNLVVWIEERVEGRKCREIEANISMGRIS